MSKTKQRKESAYKLGMEDAKINYFRFLKYPFLGSYTKGYRFGIRNIELSKNNSLLNKIRIIFNMPTL